MKLRIPSWTSFVVGAAVGFLLSAAALTGILELNGRRLLARSKARLEQLEAERKLANNRLPSPPLPFGYALSAADRRWQLKAITRAGVEPTTLGAFGGRVVLVNFWATYCGPCIAELPSLGTLARSLPADQFAVVAISLEDEKTVQRFVATHEVTLPVYVATAPPPRFLNAPVLPASYLFGREGDLLFRQAGAADWSRATVQDSIQTLLSRRPAGGPCPTGV